MRTSLRLLLIVLLAVPVVVLAGAPAQACSCADLTPQRMLEHSVAAFEGVVEERRDGVTGFEVDRVWAGEVTEHVEVAHTTDGGSCGIDPEPGERLAVFAYREDGVLSTGLCDVTDSTATVEQALGAGEPPVAGASEIDEASGVPVVPLVLGGLTLAAVGGSIAVRRRRS